MYIESSHIRTWLAQHSSEVVEQRVAADFVAYLDTLSWVGSHVDWRKISSEMLAVPEVVDENFISLCRRTPWGSHGHILVMYNGDEPAILCRLEDAVADLDFLYSSAPGTRFFCGAKVHGGEVRFMHSDFAEYDGFSKIQFRRPNSIKR